MKLSSPISCEWNLTYECNLGCVFCSLSCGRRKPEGDVWDDAHVTRAISELKKNNVVYVSLSGGEPLLHRNIVQIINTLYDEGFIVTLATNGLLLNKYFLDEVYNRIKWIQVSLQSLNEEYNIRKMGISPNVVLERIELIRSCGIGISVATIDFNEHEQELDNITNHFKSERIDHYIRTLIGEMSVDFDLNHIDIVSDSQLKYFSILPNGDIAQCSELGISAGNILHDDLNSILKNKLLRVCNPEKGCLLVK